MTFGSLSTSGWGCVVPSILDIFNLNLTTMAVLVLLLLVLLEVFINGFY